MSATYKCSKCGLTGWSKNIRFRSLFTDDQISSMMTQICDVVTEPDEKHPERRVVSFVFPHMDRPEWQGVEPNETLELEAIKCIRSLTDEQVRYWLCDHDWEHVGGEELNCSW